MTRLRLLPYLGALLLLVAVVAIVLGVLVVPEELFPVLLAVAILAGVTGVLCVVFGLLLPEFERGSVPSTGILGAATAAGRLAPARVLGVRKTGIGVGLQRDYEVDLVVAPTDHAAYRGIQYLRAGNQWLASGGAGPIVTVIRIAADDPRVVMVKDATETDQSQSVPLDAPAWVS